MSEYGDEWYLFHHTPPIGIGTTPVLYLLSPAGDLRQVGLHDIAGFEAPLVTHSFNLLVDWFRQGSIPLPRKIVELELAKKLIVGRPKSDFKKGPLPWDMSEIVAPLLPKKYDESKMRQALLTHLTMPVTGDRGDSEWMETIARLLPVVWVQLKRDLIRFGEQERFVKIEAPVHNAMLASQSYGIRLDPERRAQFLRQLEKKYLSSCHYLAITHRINVDKALHDPIYLRNCLSLKGPEEFGFLASEEIIEIFKETDPICTLFENVLSAKRNERILQRAFSIDTAFCYPVFDTMGTVTGRIHAIDPQLQHIKKEYRSIIKPRDGTSHLYVDYSQFEPNIMASLSGDSNLLKACRDVDIYSELALSIFKDSAARDSAKIVFLAYSYGMDKAGLAKLISSTTGDLLSAVTLLEADLFTTFEGVELWKESLYDTLYSQGRIGTAFGNYRYRGKEGPLDDNERRWSASQAVQGTGALILKLLILKLVRSLPTAKLLLPMHDALLIEVPTRDIKEVKQEVVALCASSFTDICPDSQPRVAFKRFAPE